MARKMFSLSQATIYAEVIQSKEKVYRGGGMCIRGQASATITAIQSSCFYSKDQSHQHDINNPRSRLDIRTSKRGLTDNMSSLLGPRSQPARTLAASGTSGATQESARHGMPTGSCYETTHIGLHVLPSPILSHELDGVRADLLRHLVVATWTLGRARKEHQRVVQVGIVVLDRLREKDGASVSMS